MGAERRDDEEEDAVEAAMISADKRRRSRTEIGSRLRRRKAKLNRPCG